MGEYAERFEFDAAADGDVIKIPPIYRQQMRGDFKIIAWRPRQQPAAPEQETEDLPSFKALRLDTKGWKFSREEANER